MPRKTAFRAAMQPSGRAASMRPRPDAAENHVPAVSPCSAAPSFNEAAARCRGKLPLPCRRGGGRGRFNEAAARCRGKPPAVDREIRPARNASMRPRPDAAENHERGAQRVVPAGASMRPRPDAAENRASSASMDRRHWSFNEAAARCRGKPPRPGSISPATRCFNEAAARCRGKPSASGAENSRRTRFNEAAARCRGKPGALRGDAEGNEALQ